MNLQEILTPIAKFIDETFRDLLVPISDLFNWGVIALGFVGLFIWLKLQSGFTKKAKQDNTLV